RWYWFLRPCTRGNHNGRHGQRNDDWSYEFSVLDLRRLSYIVRLSVASLRRVKARFAVACLAIQSYESRAVAETDVRRQLIKAKRRRVCGVEHDRAAHPFGEFHSRRSTVPARAVGWSMYFRDLVPANGRSQIAPWRRC